ncbi:MAG TPA: PAS domain S-box protein [Rhodocyclaceae bacterium]|nr:PAS domain S-box protein [Rhodocyclaceae bacterium]HMV52875.1 PAS domain S-box protein [Rhodocyclaceae bacterium]HMZ83146.1 PAS domain S-box protein [Rhodocyclaceae bacterium]HNA04496.1 PAS domain S-box protein [Rhodocyclaceae bacterium]HNB78047.1 PAS domain S-box protein [Rhodocyclaceae bacterium]
MRGTTQTFAGHHPIVISQTGISTTDTLVGLHDLPGLVYRCSPDSPRRLTQISRSPASLFDTQDDTPAESLDNWIHPDDLPRVRAAVGDAMTRGGRFAVNYRLVRTADTREIWVRDCGAVALGADRRPGDIAGLIVTIDPPVDQRLIDERALLRSVIDAIPDPIFFKSPNGVYQGCNRAFAHDLGLSEPAIAGRTDADLFPGRAVHAAEQRAQAVLATGRAQTTEQVLTRADGRVAHMELVETAYAAPDGRMLGIIGVARDVTERALTEALLHTVASDHPLAELLDAVMRFVESQAPGAIASVMLLDPPTHRLQFAAGPSLSAEFVAAMGDVAVGPHGGCCGAACHRRQLVVAEDIATDPLWEGLREIALRYGLRACWSIPIFSANGDVLGAMAVYASAPGSPDDGHLRLVDTAARIAAIAVERRNARRALRETSDRLAALVDSAMDAIVTVDADQNVVLFNDAAEKMFGLRADQALGQPISRFIPARFRERHDTSFRAFAGGGTDRLHTSLSGNVFGLRADGEEFPIEASVSRTRINGEVLFTAIIRDTTEHRRAEQSQREALARFEAVIENTPLVAIQGMTRDGIVRHWNRASTAMYGVPAEAAIGRHFTETLDCGEAADEVSREIEQVWDTGHAIGPVEWPARRIGDGKSMWLVSTLFPVFERGEVSEVFCMDVDITTRKLAEASVLQLNDELESRVRHRTGELQAALDELESFSYSVSHDLRAPLRGIDGYAQVLAEDYGKCLDETGHSHLARIRGAAQRMAALIDDLLMLAQISRSELRRERVDLSEVAQRWLLHLAALDETRHVRWTVQPGLLAQGDPALLELVLQNLLDNAWKFTGKRDDAWIEFGQRDIDGARVFHVTDNGAGFDPAYAGRMFEPFQRLHHAAQFPGTGIGLATVHRIVTRHGGRVWAESAPDRGATFFFTLG